MRGYVAVGHGLTPSGIFDPGAVHPDGTKEYNLAFAVSYKLAELLKRAGIEIVTETNAGPGHDPDYRGSVDKINAGLYDFAVEIHFDTWRAPRGGFGLYYTQTEKEWCDAVHGAWQVLALPTRDNQLRRDLYFPKATNCPAVIWECDHVGPDVTDADTTRYAVGLANGTANWLRQRFNWTPNDMEIGTMPFQPRVCTAPSGRYWVLTGPDGGVAAFEADGSKSNVYFGSLPDHPEYNAGDGKPNGPAIDIEYWPNDKGEGYVVYCDDRAEDQLVRPYHFNADTRP